MKTNYPFTHASDVPWPDAVETDARKAKAAEDAKRAADAEKQGEKIAAAVKDALAKATAI